jgi:hypothetical protein
MTARIGRARTLREGFSNVSLTQAAEGLEHKKKYKNQATVMVIPTVKTIPVPVVAAWFSLRHPQMQRMSGPNFFDGFAVDEAYNRAVDVILEHDKLKGFEFLLTMEHDNIVPRDGLLMLLESIDGGVDGNLYDAMGGLYWSRPDSVSNLFPLILGDPTEVPRNFRIQTPKEHAVQPCNGMGMGFTLFRLKMFRDGKIEKPFFETVSVEDEGGNLITQSQDINFFSKACDAGYKMAVDTRVKVGHMDPETGKVF